jgi:hypothetical protein
MISVRIRSPGWGGLFTVFGHLADAWNFTVGQVRIKIPEVLLELLDRLALSQVIRKLLEVTEPHSLVSPMNVTSGAHKLIVLVAGLQLQ